MSEESKKNSEAEKVVAKAIAGLLNINIDKVTPESSLKEDLGLDSFTAVELIFELKDEFGKEIPQDDFVKIKKVKDITTYILSH